MRAIHHICFFLFVFTIASAQKTFLDNQKFIEVYRNIRRWTAQFVGRSGTEKHLLQMAKDQNLIQTYYKAPFPCNITIGRSSVVPKSVHQLRPGDIDIIGAMGDSLTAGLGIFATNLMTFATENRGVVFSGGGQGTWREYLTLPNILKEFNPNLYGYAVSDSFTFEEESQFNVGESGAMSKDMPYMARALINRMKSDPRVNFREHWKLITLMIGANDFCSDMCYLPEASMTLDNHKSDLLQVLRLLRDELPRTLVSILGPPHLRVLVEINARSSMCDLMVDLECPCLFGLAYRSQRKNFYDIITKWHHLEEEIAQYPEFQTDDFAAVFQPSLTNLTFPVTSDGFSDMSYLSIECFHVSQKANARANYLWNNMLEPAEKKSKSWSEIFEKFACPTEEQPYITTSKNSKTL